MADLITVRLLVFLGAFFALQGLMPMVIARPTRFHGLGIIGLASFIAFVAAALVLGDPLANALFAWFVLYCIITVFMYLRWRMVDYGEALRLREEERRGYGAPEDREPPQP